MPAPGEQHLSSGGKQIINPFEEVKPRISEYTAGEIATLQSRLEKQLGPEYISSRAGPSGQKVHYVAAEKCIQLANEVFGFNGWSSQIKEVQVDFVDENPQTFKVSLGLSVIVRVTLRDGTYHEDVGYGHMENCKGKAAAFEKAKKEGTTDALKRALRNFGNVLGNCIYDKEYLSKVTKVKAQPTKWDVDRLYRHSDFVPPVKKELEVPKVVEEKSQAFGNAPSITSEDTFDDEFGDFDEADFSVADPDAHPDEVVLPEPPEAPRHFNGRRNGSTGPNGGLSASRPVNRQSMPPPRPQNVSNGGHNLNNINNGNNSGNIPPQPHTPNAGFTRTSSGGAQVVRQPQGPGPQPQPIPQVQPQIAGRVLNQPSRNGIALGPAPASPARPNRPADETDPTNLPPQGAGFFSARGVAMVPEGQPTEGPPQPLPNNLPVFNPHAESPSIRKTPGVDHKSSKPLTKDLKHVQGSSQTTTATSPAPAPRGNVVNLQLDPMRRIGAPGSPNPMINRNQYKPPTIKRPLDSGNAGSGSGPGLGQNATRTPLHDLPANGPIVATDVGGDAKRQRLNGAS